MCAGCGCESTGILLMRNEGLGGEGELGAGCRQDALASRSARIVVSRSSRNFMLPKNTITSRDLVGGQLTACQMCQCRACLQARAVVFPLKPIKAEDLGVRAAN
jgi:hypothetical protein